MNAPLSRHRFVLRSMTASLSLHWLPSLMADDVGNGSSVEAAKGAGAGARRFVAVGNLLHYQQKSFFPTTTGDGYESIPLLKPLESNRSHMTVYRGLDHGIKGGISPCIPLCRVCCITRRTTCMMGTSRSISSLQIV